MSARVNLVSTLGLYLFTPFGVPREFIDTNRTVCLGNYNPSCIIGSIFWVHTCALRDELRRELDLLSYTFDTEKCYE